MVDYLYDGSFSGFLTCVYLHYYEGKASGIFPEDSYQASMLSACRKVPAEPDFADKVYRAIEEKISPKALKRVYYIFLSNVPDKDNIAFQYIRLGFRMGGKIDSLHSHPSVFTAQQTAKKVAFEAHRMGGLVRFSVLESPPAAEEEQGVCMEQNPDEKPRESDEKLRDPGEKLRDPGEKLRDPDQGQILYARIKPDHDILELIGEHFSDRFKNQPFVIHDARRQKALYSKKGVWIIAPLDEGFLPNPAADEKEYRRLWKTYFEHIAIESRKNPRCQKRLMPVRYWENLTEMREMPLE